MHDLLQVLGTVAAIAIVLLIVVLAFGRIVWRASGIDRMNVEAEDADVWSGSFAQQASVILEGPAERALQIGVEALRKVGTQDLARINQGTVSGWFHRPFMPMADRQLAVTVRAESPGHVTVLCSCRPRFSRELADFGVCRKLSRQLATDVTEIDRRSTHSDQRAQ